jgi:hypothetical protein
MNETKKEIDMDKKQAWYIFHNSPAQIGKWEHPAGSPEAVKWNAPYGTGLALDGCPHCGEFQTRETYVSGFWVENIELVTDYSCSGISLCKCGAWSHWVH